MDIVEMLALFMVAVAVIGTWLWATRDGLDDEPG